MVITKNEFVLAINQIATERGISPEDVLRSIEEAVLVAYKKETDSEEVEGLEAKINPETGEVRIFKDGKDITPKNFGRIAAQTAKQVIIQKIREAEKERVVKFYEDKVGTLVKGRVIRRDRRGVFMDIGRAEGYLPKEEQIEDEDYSPNSVYTVLIKEIRQDKFGNYRIILSRRDNKLLLELLKREVPEIESGAIEIKKIVRVPGERVKVAVYAESKIIDPVGACVGQKGVRVQAITRELGGEEKVDVIPYTEDVEKMIRYSLAPAEIEKIELDHDKKEAKVYVKEEQAAWAIGQKGVNVNLTVKLTGYNIDIIQIKSPKESSSKDQNEEKEETQEAS